MSLKKFLSSFFAFFWLIFSSSPSNAAEAYLDWDQVPREIKTALSLFSKVENNQLTSKLSGETTGFVEVGVFIETLNDFKLFKSKLEFLTLPGFENWEITVTQTPEEKKIFDPISKGLVDGYAGQLLFRVRLNLKSPQSFSVSPSSKLPLVIGFQACSKTVCLFPVKVKLNTPLVESPAATDTKNVSFFKQIEDKFSKSFSLSQGDSANPIAALTWTKIVILFLAGLLTAFTPCVYPLYPITLGIFGRWTKGASPISGFLLVSSYCAGIVLSYALLGTLAAASGSLFGSLTQTPTFLLSVGFVILFFALVFSGFLPFPIFDHMQNWVSKLIPASSESKSKQKLISFLMGATLGLVASPCVGPVLIVVLSWLAMILKSGSLEAFGTGFFLLSIFGLGMSLPLFVLGHFAFRVGTIPKLGGKFAPLVKNIGTLLMVGSSLFFLVPGFKILFKSPSESHSASVSYTVYSLENWPKTHPTVIDFRADWCAACIDLEQKTFNSELISSRFVAGTWHFISVDLTESNPTTDKIISDYSLVGLPTVFITDAKGKVCSSLSLFGFEPPEEFKKRMDAASTGARHYSSRNFKYSERAISSPVRDNHQCSTGKLGLSTPKEKT